MKFLYPKKKKDTKNICNMVLMRTNKKVLKLLSIKNNYQPKKKNNYFFLSVTSKIGCGRHF